MLQNKDFHNLILSVINRLQTDNTVKKVIPVIDNTLNRYNLQLNNISIFSDNVEYQKVFLSIYYDLVFQAYQITLMNEEGKEDIAMEIAINYFDTALNHANLFNEYGTREISRREYIHLCEKYGLKILKGEAHNG